jgi:mRNA-degrading endonuclease RelE of RelBE toxin-antitoxin system
MPRYKVSFDARAKRDLDKLGDGARKSIIGEIELLESDASPPSSKALDEPLNGFWRLTADNVRAIYEPPDASDTIWIRAIGYRRSIYEDFKPDRD